MNSIELVYNKLDELWEREITASIISKVLIFIFAATLGFVFILKLIGGRALGIDANSVNYFLAIDIAFSTLLVFEILGLVFVLPKSVANSVGKQFEILSIILLRAAFKEFGYFSDHIIEGSIQYQELLPMLSDAFGALLIFFVIGLYYRLQRHERITQSDLEQTRFISFKKIVAFFLLIGFLWVGIWSIYILVTTGKFNAPFNTFYTILIFSDLLILMFSLRYHSAYMNLFRFSSFAFATLLIRLSLSAPAYINGLLGVLAGVFVLGLTLAYNYFKKNELTNLRFDKG